MCKYASHQMKLEISQTKGQELGFLEYINSDIN
jgi:hypothetical protein